MQPIALAAILAIIVPISGMVWLSFTGDRAGLRRIKANLGGRPSQAVQSLNISQQFTDLSKRITPKSYEAWLDKQLAGAGRPKQWPLTRILMVKPLLAFAGALLGLVVFLGAPSAGRFAIAVVMVALAYFVPDLLIRNRAQKRREEIRLELPNALDQMLISVQAGLGFESAMGRAGENGRGPLADELIRTLQDIQVGRSRKEAYLALSERVDVPSVRTFVRAVVQADTYGIAIAGVLKTQAKDMRIKRRQLAEEHAMKMPVKMLFPLIFFILPTLFIVLLGPAVLQIMSVFS
ncbi:type II secretion system F family protein [Paenarthrobacter sp. NEAU-H11]|uniref:type II secretion system F family protein n=1 Tax=Paenarthrobacter sp. NEAU-H11 TaxID=3423924 RepID=UPI003D32799D